MHLPRARRRLVFYSEGRNYWPHLEGLIRCSLEDHGHSILYLTSDPADPGLRFEHDRFHASNIGHGSVRNWVFANLDADVVVTTTPDLENFQLKRSRHGVHYVYVQHSLCSLHMGYRSGAFDHFDTMFCSGPHHCRETRALESQRGTPEKTLVEHGYPRLAAIIAEAHKHPNPALSKTEPYHVLVAPSWGPNGVIETQGGPLIGILLEAGFDVTLRPHPQTLVLAPEAVERVAARHRGNDRLTVEDNVAGQDSLHASHIMIGDWGGTALEYAFGLKKPVIFIDTPRKVNNPAYETVGLDPIEVSIRDQIGAIVAPSDLPSLPSLIRETLSRERTGSDLERLRDEVVFNIGTQDDVGARYIDTLLR
jgi:hypothetical protein